jgi:hypothetical protein
LKITEATMATNAAIMFTTYNRNRKDKDFLYDPT